MLEYALLLLFAGATVVYLTFRRAFVSLLSAVNEKDHDRIYRVLTSGFFGRVLALLKRKLVAEALDILFFSARFEEFATVVETLGLDDPRAFLISDEEMVLSLDIETEVDVESRPREIGLSTFLVRDWSEIFRIRIDDLNTFKDRYGADLDYFMNRLLDRFDRVVGHNIYEFDAPILKKWGIDLSGKLLIDTLALSYIVLPEMPSLSLEFLCKFFGIEYEAHEPEDDSFASAALLQYLLSIAFMKRLDLDALASMFEPIRGLRNLEIPLIEISYPPERRSVRSDSLLVVPDASRYENSWYPTVIDPPELEEIDLRERARGMALYTIYSYTAGGGRDPLSLEELANLLMGKGNPYDEYGRALLEETRSRTRKCPLPRDGFAVEHRYLSDILPNLRRKFKIIYLRGWMILETYGHPIHDVVGRLRNLADEVVIESPLPPPVDGVKYVNPRGSREGRRILFVKKGLDVGIRHTNYLASLLSSLLSRRRKMIFVSNYREKLAAEKASSYRRAITSVLIPKDKYRLIRMSYQFSSMGYEVIAFSLSSLSAKLGTDQEVLLGGMAEASWLAGSSLTVVSARSWILEEDRLSGLIRVVEVEPDEGFRPRIPLIAFESIEEAVKEAEEVVRETWGFNVRPYQRRCISRMLASYCPGHQMTKPLSIIILPTGSGKSLIFQAVARLLRKRIRGTTIVISPLLALMRDQVNSLKRRGFRVCEISSASTDRGLCLHGFQLGKFDIVYITPEQLRKDDVRRALESAEINYIVIDEIHTMHKWKDFRPSYSFLANYLRKRREEGFWFPLAGFTATITGEGLEDVIDMLTGSTMFNLDHIDFKTDFNGQPDLHEVEVIKGPVLRDNLILDVHIAGRRRLEGLADVVRGLREWADNVGKPWIGLIFVGFVRSKRWYENASYVARYLEEELGERVTYFHGQLDTRSKEKRLKLIEEASKGHIEEPRIVVSTKAFGMGVDIPNIRWVVHHMMPESVEDYYQEIGRAGRDGLDAKAIMLYSRDYDFKRRMWLLRTGVVRPGFILDVYSRLKGAKEGSIVPVALLIPRKTLSSKYKDIQGSKRALGDIESSVERALAVLNAVGVLDYDIVYREIAVVPSSNELTAFRVGRRYMVVPRDSAQGPMFDLKLEPNGGFSVVRGEGLFKGRRTKCVQVNYLSEEVDLESIKRLVREEWERQVISLSLMNSFCDEVSRTPSERRNGLARRLVERYLSGSLEELYREIISRKDEALSTVIGDRVLSIYERMRRGGIIVRMPEKEEIVKLFSSLVVLHMVRERELPSKLVVGVPYGYKGSLEGRISDLLNELELPPVLPKIVSVTKRTSRCGDEVREALAGSDEMLLLITNQTMAIFKERCTSALGLKRVYYLGVRR